VERRRAHRGSTLSRTLIFLADDSSWALCRRHMASRAPANGPAGCRPAPAPACGDRRLCRARRRGQAFVESSDLKEADTEVLRTIAELAAWRDEVESELTKAVRSAREAHRSWSEICAMLGVSKQAAQQKYGSKVTA
jgi:hypothetical protein